MWQVIFRAGMTILASSGLILRPPARGPLVDGCRQRQDAPIAGAIGLAPDKIQLLMQRWAQAEPVQLLLEPGLALESYACYRGDLKLSQPEQWIKLLSEQSLEQVSGAFVLAWHQGESLCLVRDAVGERSLFYAPWQQGLIFASTLDLLLQSGLFKPKLNPEVLLRYLSYAYVPGRESLIEGVYELEPGEQLIFSQGQLQRKAWWRFEPQSWLAMESAESLKAALRQRLEEAVCRRLPASDTICASLSGGLDSSLVVALLRRFHAGELRTFSISFGPKYRNELPFSQYLAEQCQTRHQVLEAQPKTVMHHFDQTIGLMGNPIGDPLTVPNALIFKEASRYSPVLFNGEGGDPNFGGPKNIPMVLSQLYGDAFHQRYGESTFLRERTYLRSYRKLYEDLPELIRPQLWQELAPDCLERQLASWLDPAAGESFVQKLMAINTRFKGAHHILFKVNALSRAFGVCPASPLFDQQLTALAFAIPPQLKLKGTIEKYLLKEAVADLVPARILQRPKSGMQVPVEFWFQPRGPLHREARKRLRRLEDTPWFEPAYLRRLMNWELPGFLPRHGPKVWILLTFEAWLRKYL